MCMSIKDRVLGRIADALLAHAFKYPYPSIYDPETGELYMRRGWLLKRRWWCPVSIRIHEIVRSDKDRHCHDHPFHYVTWLLKAGYWETVRHMNGKMDIPRWRKPGSLLFRPCGFAHRLDVLPYNPAVSLFIMFRPRKPRKWGFWVGDQWVWWREYLNDFDTQESGETS